MYGLSSGLQITQTLLEVDGKLMFGLFLRLQILLVEKLGLRGGLGLIVGLIDVKELVEVDIGVLNRHVVVDEGLPPCP